MTSFQFIPLFYSGTIAARGKVSTTQAYLTSVVWHVEIPDSIRRLSGNRPDIMVELFRQDVSLAHRLRPIYTCLTLTLGLSQVVLRPMLWELIQKSYFARTDYDKTSIKQQIKLIKQTIGRIGYKNSDHTDCRIENLTEVQHAFSDAPINNNPTDDGGDDGDGYVTNLS